MDCSTKSRRWFRYSLRSLLVLITALCVLLGPPALLVRRRTNLLEVLLQAGGRAVDLSFIGEDGIPFSINADGQVTWIKSVPDGPSPWRMICHWFGDREIGLILLDEKIYDQRDEFALTFPEAVIVKSSNR
jgi:hypothetical protein